MRKTHLVEYILKNCMMFYIFVKINDELTNAIFFNILFSFFKKFGLHVTHSIIILLPYFSKH